MTNEIQIIGVIFGLTGFILLLPQTKRRLHSFLISRRKWSYDPKELLDNVENDFLKEGKIKKIFEMIGISLIVLAFLLQFLIFL